MIEFKTRNKSSSKDLGDSIMNNVKLLKEIERMRQVIFVSEQEKVSSKIVDKLRSKLEDLELQVKND